MTQYFDITNNYSTVVKETEQEKFKLERGCDAFSKVNVESGFR